MKTKKYLFYAVGEILLLMVGILLALQVNNWNENRKDRHKEKELMESILQEFKADSAQLENLLKIILEKADDGNVIISYLQKEMPDLDSSDLLSDIYLIGRYIQYDPSLPTFDEILSSGQSTLIRSRVFKDEIKKYLKICDFHESFLYEEGRESKVLYNRHIRKYFDYRLFSEYWNHGKIELTDLKDELSTQNLLIDFEGFKKDPQSLYYTRQVVGTDRELYSILTIVKNNFLIPTIAKLENEISLL